MQHGAFSTIKLTLKDQKAVFAFEVASPTLAVFVNELKVERSRLVCPNIMDL